MAWITGKPGHYRVQWREGGKVRSSETIESKGEAEALLRDREADAILSRHKAKPSASMSLAALLDRWKESRKASKRVRDPYAAEVKDTLETIAKGAGWKAAGDITAESFDRYRAKRDGKGTDRPLAMLKSVLGYGKRVLRLRVDDALLDMEPTRAADKRQQPPLLTEAQVLAILYRAQEFGDSVATMLEHLATYGCRPVDLCKATVGDWEPDRRRMAYRDTKNGATQHRPILDDHAVKLDALCMAKVDNVYAQRKPDEKLFLSPYGMPWEVDWKGSATQLTSWYRNNVARHLLIRTGKDGSEVGCLHVSQLGIYCLKDFGLSRAEKRLGRRAAMALSQHKTESAFRRYLATNEDEQREALAVLALPATPWPKPTPTATNESEA